MKLDLNYVEKVIKIFSENDLSEITLEDAGKVITLKKEKAVVTQTIASQPAYASPVTSQVVSELKAEAKPEVKGKPILSPMVGTFYKAPSPDSKPFVQVGDTVATGQVVCIVEAMKLMNEIEAEVSGKVIQILVQDGEPVEYGQVLMYVE